ncbi:cyclodeaminase/cyclohydrolase family protein [Clostridium sp. AM58-1XD]|uniref:cyclodeaminase/cyclohydrolase family protein n=1 Tax=Clostridium sp. AM58-1XD TaxID=2292307 RepID=UPI000E550EBA|nr:cyclodeaminase/cyclohydrolase family protein [Clostridium sp. AM58-1XD]RGY99086.1 sugar ABC transporter substrate-binding protein [Clostridium sp. AM58-1XD]
MTEKNTIEEFLNVLSSKAPVPGGGGASAIGGAIGNGLGQMVANLTIGKKRYADVEEEIGELLERMKELQKEFVDLADKDAAVFAPLAAAYSMPAGNEAEQKYKEDIMEMNLLGASLVPIQLMERSLEMLLIMGVLAEKGSRMAVSDVGVGVQFIRAALTGAAMNVFINTKSMRNRDKADELNKRAKTMIEVGTKKADEIYGQVLEGLCS